MFLCPLLPQSIVPELRQISITSDNTFLKLRRALRMNCMEDLIWDQTWQINLNCLRSVWQIYQGSQLNYSVYIFDLTNLNKHTHMMTQDRNWHQAIS